MVETSLWKLAGPTVEEITSMGFELNAIDLAYEKEETRLATALRAI